VIEIQLLIMFYKDELKVNPDCVVSKAMLQRNREKLLDLKMESLYEYCDK